MPLCSVCQDEHLDPMYASVKDHYRMAKQEYRFLKCANCGSAVLDPFPTPEELLRIYPPRYTFKTHQHKEGLRRILDRFEWHLFYKFLFRQRVRSLIKFTHLTSGRILDVGCGSGLLLKSFRDRGFDVQGVEVSSADATYAEESLNLKIHLGAVTEANFPEESFDAVTLYYVLEHLATPFQTVCEIMRILKPGGWIVLVVPLIDSWEAALFKDKWSQISEAPRHLCIPSSKGVKSMLERSGFGQVRMSNVSLLEIAELIAISIYPSAATAVTKNGHGGILKRGLGGLIGAFSIIMALAERTVSSESRPCGAMSFFARKPIAV